MIRGHANTVLAGKIQGRGTGEAINLVGDTLSLKNPKTETKGKGKKKKNFLKYSNKRVVFTI